MGDPGPAEWEIRDLLNGKSRSSLPRRQRPLSPPALVTRSLGRQAEGNDEDSGSVTDAWGLDSGNT